MTSRPTRGIPCRVRCLETGVEYDSITAAAKAAGVPLATFRDRLQTGHLCAGFHWRLQPRAEPGWPASHPWKRHPLNGKRRS